MSKGNWFKVNRRIFDHPWLMQRPEWFMAWITIIGAANHKTGEVNLTEVYRTLRKHYNKDSWRHLVGKLSADKMVEVVKVENRGSGAGKIQTARIVNFFEYQATPDEAKTARSQPPSQRAASAQPNADLDEENTTSARSQPPSQRAASALVLQEYKEVKEIKEKTPPTPPSSEDMAGRRMKFKTTETGQLLHAILGTELKRQDLFLEAERWSEKYSAAEIEAAEKQSMSADRSPIELFKLIMRGRVALDKKLLPEPPKPELPPIGAVVEHPLHGVNKVTYHTQDGEIELNHGWIVPPSEVRVCRN